MKSLLEAPPAAMSPFSFHCAPTLHPGVGALSLSVRHLIYSLDGGGYPGKWGNHFSLKIQGNVLFRDLMVLSSFLGVSKQTKKLFKGQHKINRSFIFPSKSTKTTTKARWSGCGVRGCHRNTTLRRKSETPRA